MCFVSLAIFPLVVAVSEVRGSWDQAVEGVCQNHHVHRRLLRRVKKRLRQGEFIWVMTVFKTWVTNNAFPKVPSRHPSRQYGKTFGRATGISTACSFGQFYFGILKAKKFGRFLLACREIVCMRPSIATLKCRHLWRWKRRIPPAGRRLGAGGCRGGGQGRGGHKGTEAFLQCISLGCGGCTVCRGL